MNLSGWARRAGLCCLLAMAAAGCTEATSGALDQAGDASLAGGAAAPVALRTDTAGAGSLAPLITQHAEKAGVPPALAHAVVRLESRYNPRAAHRGNYGLMQIRLGTARSLGYAGGAHGLLDADTNLTYGMRYLAGAWQLAGGDPCRAIMKYQSGHRAVRPSRANLAYCAKARAMMAAE